MKLAESPRVRWFLAATATALIGSSAALILTRPCPNKKVVVERRDPLMIRGCHQRAVAPTPPPPVAHEITGADYRDALLAIEPAFKACVVKADASVSYRIGIDLRPDGTVRSVDVRSEAKDMKKVSLKTTACLEKAVLSASFPAAGTDKRVSTRLEPDKLE